MVRLRVLASPLPNEMTPKHANTGQFVDIKTMQFEGKIAIEEKTWMIQVRGGVTRCAKFIKSIDPPSEYDLIDIDKPWML
ncbi:uncharacterized protein EI90DRAFT_3030094 [Cantharellus anzutake]|uniref:uncharacterized protein n=1 Tax=Cantharellus anzutake TaxID=1750568 RepID=UPI00190792B9|nr:uncharacterized protein EI90DRAFT_3030094 [Cantharellus anzutake]KAF8342752.1 hypothetical protein EI90DRAFT_3030094 [Cantharellus anzutake]